MKNLRMILSAVIVFAIVGSALAFKTKDAVNLYHCVEEVCVINNEDLSSVPSPDEIPNPGDLFATPNPAELECGDPNDPCKPYNGRVFINE